MAERVRVREISNEEGDRLLRIVRHSSGPVVTWRRAQMVLLSAQGMDVPQIAKGDLHRPGTGPREPAQPQPSRRSCSTSTTGRRSQVRAAASC